MKMGRVALLLPAALAFTGCRQDMFDQPKYRPLGEEPVLCRRPVGAARPRGHVPVSIKLITARRLSAAPSTAISSRAIPVARRRSSCLAAARTASTSIAAPATVAWAMAMEWSQNADSSSRPICTASGCAMRHPVTSTPSSQTATAPCPIIRIRFQSRTGGPSSPISVRWNSAVVRLLRTCLRINSPAWRMRDEHALRRFRRIGAGPAPLADARAGESGPCCWPFPSRVRFSVRAISSTATLSDFCSGWVWR